MTCPRCQAENRDGARFCRGMRRAVWRRLSQPAAPRWRPAASSATVRGPRHSGSVAPVPLRIAPRATPPSTSPRRSSPRRRPRRRAQAGDGAVRRPQGLDGAARRPGPRGGPEAPRPRPRADDGGRPPLRGHGQPGDGRRDHGALRRAAGPRGPRRAGLLCRARHAGSDPTYAEEIRRSHGSRVKIRVGLNSGEVVVRAIGSDLRMDYTAVGQTTHLAARMEQLADPGSIAVARRDARAGRGLRRGEVAGPGAGEGARRAGGDLRAGRRRAAPLPPGRERRPRAHQVRRAGRRARAAAAGARPRGDGSRPGRGPRRRAGRRQVAPGVGGGPLPPHARLAHRAGELSLLRQQHALPAAGRAPQGLLPDRASRRSPEGPGEADRQGADARSGPPACYRGRSSRSWTCRWRIQGGRRSSPRSATTERWTP